MYLKQSDLIIEHKTSVKGHTFYLWFATEFAHRNVSAHRENVNGIFEKVAIVLETNLFFLLSKYEMIYLFKMARPWLDNCDIVRSSSYDGKIAFYYLPR